MPRRDHLPAVGEYYHVFNRGVEKRTIFSDAADYRRFEQIVEYYLNPNPPISFSQRHRIPRIQFQELDLREEPLVEIVAYCLMPNHFHFLVKCNTEGGLTTWIRRATSSYTHAFNVRNYRVGPLFQGPYKVVRIADNDQLIHVCRYIHLNPVVARLCSSARDYRYSSMAAYVGEKQPTFIRPAIILDQFDTTKDFAAFVDDHSAYAMGLDRIKHLIFEEE